MIDGDAHCTPGRELLRPRAAALSEPRKQAADGSYFRGQSNAFTGSAEHIAKSRQIEKANHGAMVAQGGVPMKNAGA